MDGWMVKTKWEDPPRKLGGQTTTPIHTVKYTDVADGYLFPKAAGLFYCNILHRFLELLRKME